MDVNPVLASDLREDPNLLLRAALYQGILTKARNNAGQLLSFATETAGFVGTSQTDISEANNTPHRALIALHLDWVNVQSPVGNTANT
jgi:hypothetical protein